MPEASSRIEELQRELVANPASRQFYQLGELLRRDGRAAEAVGVLRLGLTHHPKYLAAWVSLGRALADAGDPADAATALRSAIELDPQNPVAWHLLGDALLGVGDRAGALEAMRKALALVPGDEVLQSAVDALSQEPEPPAEEHHEAAPTEAEAAPAPTFEEALAAEKAPEYDTLGAPEIAPARMESVETQPEIEAVPGLIRDIPAPPPEQVEGLERLGFEAAAPTPAPAASEAIDPFAVTGTFAPSATPSGDVFADAFAHEGAPALEPEGPFGGGVGGPGAVSIPTEMPSAAREPHAGARILLAEPSIEAPAVYAEAPLEAAPAAEGAVLPPAEPGVAEPNHEVATETPGLLEPWEDPSRTARPEILQAAVAEAAAPPPAAPVSALAAWLRHGGGSSDDAAAVAGLVPPVAAEPRAPAREPAPQPATITLARLYIQQQDFTSATATLERMLDAEPTNQEARDLLELVRDMMGPMPEALPPLALKERKIAALQRWAASLTLGRERMGR